MAFLKNIMSAAALIGAFTAGTANAAYIPDTYLGKDTNYGTPGDTDYSNTDVVGGNYFQVYGANAGFNQNTGILTVMIDTNFFEQPGNNRFFGDLFISIDGYNPVSPSSADYGLDAFGKQNGPGENWEYAFDTDALGLLELDGTETITDGSTRQGHEYRVASGGKAVAGGSTFQNLGPVNGFQGSNVLRYDIDFSFLQSPADFAVHWTMYCANDVFEAPVSEPGSLALLSLGLIGLGAIRRKSAKR